MVLEVTSGIREVLGYCGLCSVHCPTITSVQDGRILELRPDREHPRGGAICAKGRAAPELVYHKSAFRRIF